MGDTKFNEKGYCDKEFVGIPYRLYESDLTHKNAIYTIVYLDIDTGYRFMENRINYVKSKKFPFNREKSEDYSELPYPELKDITGDRSYFKIQYEFHPETGNPQSRDFHQWDGNFKQYLYEYSSKKYDEMFQDKFDVMRAIKHSNSDLERSILYRYIELLDFNENLKLSHESCCPFKENTVIIERDDSDFVTVNGIRKHTSEVNPKWLSS